LNSQSIRRESQSRNASTSLTMANAPRKRPDLKLRSQ
jgi:hypothetical protein